MRVSRKILDTVIAVAMATFVAYYAWDMASPKAMCLYLLILCGTVAFKKSLEALDVLISFAAGIAVWMILKPFQEGFDDKTPRKEHAEKEHKENFDDAHVDLGSTFLKAYSKLSPDMVKDMRTDTKDLMDTQKKLMETLSNMGPAVQQGVDLIENFKKYFGSSSPGL